MTSTDLVITGIAMGVAFLVIKRLRPKLTVEGHSVAIQIFDAT
jgi:hypothetical protein